jgi:hypothetical protein
LLTCYQNEFSAALHRQGAKLMVIGYSFGDQHINEIIGQAADQGSLTLFIVDPAGVSVVEPLTDRLSPHIRGASRRPLSDTFFNDHVEHDKLMAFLNG